ncbi:MAG: sodium:proton exchanger [Rhodopirellula sp.]|nr:sodium:proton exchanger [Rhodopirellula sp.]
MIYLICVPVLGISAQWLAWRLRLPSILLLLGFGILLGQAITPTGVIKNLPRIDNATKHADSHLEQSNEAMLPAVDEHGNPYKSEQAHPLHGGAIDVNALLLPLVSFCVAIILFEGGLTLRFSELKEAGSATIRLCTLGAGVTWILSTIAVYSVAGFANWELSALVGAFMVVTGPTVVIPLLRHIHPSKKMGSIAKWEGIIIDPIGAVLAVLVFEFIRNYGQGGSLWSVILALLVTIVTGLVIAYGSSKLLLLFTRKYWIPDYLHGVVFLAVALGTFGISNLIQPESGLLTVTVLGILLVNQKEVSIHHIIEFKEHLGVFLISSLFIVLGSNFDLSQISEVGWQGLGFLAVMIIIVRPASVFISTIRSDLSFKEKVFLSFLAPRGIVAAAVASVFALELGHIGGMDQALVDKIVPLTFILIVGTVAVYGLGAAPLARLLGLSETNPQGILFAGADQWVRDLAVALQQTGHNVLMLDTSFNNWSQCRMVGIPAECASVLSDYVQEELDLSGIGRVMAVTPNDEVNALTMQEFSSIFGRQNIYRMPPWDYKKGRRSSEGGHAAGRWICHPQVTHNLMRRQVRDGGTFKVTRISDEFTYEHFIERNGANCILFFTIDTSNNLLINTVENPLKVKAGDTIVSFVPGIELGFDPNVIEEH